MNCHLLFLYHTFYYQKSRTHIREAGVAESVDNFTKFSTISQ
ncbi:hypothetical protein RintRC_4724 [Richelia intracellularis]|nr:hypothetical protein RintRC_4724 [Richelia intracellularis]